MTPEAQAVWQPFRERVAALVDDVEWSEYDTEPCLFLDNKPVPTTRRVKVRVVICGQARAWSERAPTDTEQAKAVDILADWLAGIEWQIQRLAAGLPMIEVGGNCPVQGYEIRDGWLFYFRARDGWSLSAWPPGTWAATGAPDQCPQAALDDVDLFSPPVEVCEAHEDEHFPRPSDLEAGYEGWWSDAYATKVAEWAIAKAVAVHAAEAVES